MLKLCLWGFFLCDFCFVCVYLFVLNLDLILTLRKIIFLKIHRKSVAIETLLLSSQNHSLPFCDVFLFSSLFSEVKQCKYLHEKIPVSSCVGGDWL